MNTKLGACFNNIVIQKSRFLFISVSLIVCIYFQVKGLGNDFKSFYSAGLSVGKLESPWEVNKADEFSAYLNGPITALILSVFSLLPYEISLLIIRLITLALIPYTLKSMLKIFNVYYTAEQRYSLSTLLLFTFPIRSCLEYGQLSSIYLSLYVIFLALIKSRKNKMLLFMFGLASCTVLDYKPQIFLPIIIFFRYRSIHFLSGLISGVVLAWFINFKLTGDRFFNSWVDAIWVRSQTVSNRGDQMSLYSLLNLNQTATKLVFFAFLSAAVISIRLSKAQRNFDPSQKVLFSLLLWSSITPFSHPTDMLISQLFISVLILKLYGTPSTNLVLPALGFATVWSNSFILSSIVFLSLVLLSRYFIFANTYINLFTQLFFLIPPVIFSLGSIRYPTLEVDARQLLNYLSICIPVVMLLHQNMQRKFVT